MNPPPLMSFNFLVVFYGIGGGNGVPNTLDIRFQRVSGLGLSVNSTDKVRMGGHTVNLPNYPEHSNLTLERGYVLGSPLRIELQETFANLQFTPRDVMVILLDPQGQAQVSWLFMDAYPTKWVMGDLDANQSSVFVETIELSYTHFQPVSL
ncbi:MAG TPA: phage tail protein [Microscillaceae bacterium]|nr:phage tail protein [Microscillaceae bacterium]